MKPIIIAKNKDHLKELIKNEIKDMTELFYKSEFNGDISKWNVSNLKDMSFMFAYSSFNNNISQWDVSQVTRMDDMFKQSSFSQNLTNWKPYYLKYISRDMFKSCKIEEPYWANFEDKKERKKAIDSYHIHKELNHQLSENNNSFKKIKI